MNLYHLQRALYVMNMNQHKSRTKPVTLERLEKDVVRACRDIVAAADAHEAG